MTQNGINGNHEFVTKYIFPVLKWRTIIIQNIKNEVTIYFESILPACMRKINH